MTRNCCLWLQHRFSKFHSSQAGWQISLFSVVAFILSACHPLASLPYQRESESPLPAEIEIYVNGRERSVVLRANIESLSKAARQESPAKGGFSPELIIRFRDLRRNYFAIREALFEITFLYVSGIVERPVGQDLRSLLLKTSLSLLAAADLVQNFHTLAGMLAENNALLALWNESDVAHGIPDGSWKILLETSRVAPYHDLFKEAIGRLREYRRHLDGYHQEGERAFLALYPQGIDAALQEAAQSFALLRAEFGAEDLTQDGQELGALVERSKTLRTGWAAFAPALREAIARDKGLIRGNVHVQVHQAKREYLDLREGLYHLAFKHVAKLTRPDIPYPKLFRLRAVAVSLLAAVTLYENAHQLQNHASPSLA